MNDEESQQGATAEPKRLTKREAKAIGYALAAGVLHQRDGLTVLEELYRRGIKGDEHNVHAVDDVLKLVETTLRIRAQKLGDPELKGKQP